MYTDIFSHARSFVDEIDRQSSQIHAVLRQYESYEVVEDEIARSIEALQSLHELERYFGSSPLSFKTATFMPLNLPLYSLVLFALMPAYQSVSLIIKAPQIMRKLYVELFEALSISTFYPNISLFGGTRNEFITTHCAQSTVIIFTGKYENFLSVKKMCGKDSLILFNGVGHNPIVVTASADVDLAVDETLKVKLFNNGQDCAGPDIILVHSLVVDIFAKKLVERLSQVQCGNDYSDDQTCVGPMFETSSLLSSAKLITELCARGAVIHYGGQIDFHHNVLFPCVIKTELSRIQNFTELYSPLFVIAEYHHDTELGLYFRDVGGRYQHNEMYISLFGESNFVNDMHGSIILKDCIVHGVERGTEEYGGYSPGASLVSHKGLILPKPVLIPREIYNFLSSKGRDIFRQSDCSDNIREQQIIASLFQDKVRSIFGDEVAFAYIFGSFAIGKDKRFSDIDTFVCLHHKRDKQVSEYLEWVFEVHEMFGRIPDFKYPAEIVTLGNLKEAVASLSGLELSACGNSAEQYDAMVWCHSLSQPMLGAINEASIPFEWRHIFPDHSDRILRSFLVNLENSVLDGSKAIGARAEVYEIPRKEPELSQFIANLSSWNLVHVLKMIPFEEVPAYTADVLRLVGEREFMGRKRFDRNSPDSLYHPCFRFGVVDSRITSALF